MPRYLSLVRVDESTGPAGGPSAELMQRMGELIEEMTKAGVLLDTAGLTPSAEAVRTEWDGEKVSVTDGPFTESKEVVGGYALMQCKDRAEALEWTQRFLKVHGPEWRLACELREIAEG
ncbi:MULTISPECIES: YciI family protein [Streptomyces]|uniref:YciI family protein n=1 Tax=Streptomyces flaveolus TaxID=67297 RepID=A0ABV3A4P6_9ACTN|nr:MULTISPECIES: YciI family protein [Streptomyces]KMS93126.1 transcriptional regulator [Streptomyces regensis]KOG59798.1 transcriptional regulator [Streptomyces antibioticus]KOV92447.1 transcriptional regulator [Streptomyces sp. NRRL WC-3723]MBG7700669.1 transcriptional regulator [Streptomyces sp. MC1]